MLYAVVGTAPLYLPSLTTIIASRFALGLIEAGLMTVSTTMIGDYYEGTRRERFMSLQTTVAATSAFVFNNLGGAIAEHGRRAPYAVFAIRLLLAPLMVSFLWEPRTRASMTAEQLAADASTFRPGLLAFICALGIVLGQSSHTVGFRQAPEFAEWRAIVGPFFASPPKVEHFDMLPGGFSPEVVM